MDAGMMDFSDPGGDDATALSRDKVLVRSMNRDDLERMIRIDAKLTGRDRAAYFNDKWLEITGSAGVRVSLVAEMDGLMAGFVMARVDYGEYGRAESVAVMDTIGVDEGFAHQGVGHALMSQLMFNLKGLQVETLRTNVSWGQFALMRFLDDTGFSPAQRLSLVLPLT
jgi:ribosomal protein S18 acetylase RimI-like enzyme